MALYVPTIISIIFLKNFRYFKFCSLKWWTEIHDWLKRYQFFLIENYCPPVLCLIYDSFFLSFFLLFWWSFIVFYRLCATLIRRVDFSPGRESDEQGAVTFVCKYYRRPIKFSSSDLNWDNWAIACKGKLKLTLYLKIGMFDVFF